MSNIILYTNHCPMCDILKEKLDKNNIKYVVEDNVDKLKDLGFTHMPVLKINNNCLGFKDALNYLSGGNNSVS